MYNRKLAKLMSHSYQILALILVLVAAGLLLLPKYERHEGIDPESLLANSVSTERYISTDELAHKIISQDPSILVIDVRDADRYKTYSIPGSLHIPLNEILNDENVEYLDQNAYEVILYSDDNFYSDQAWILCNRLGYRNMRVLEGGLNAWFKTVIHPPVPDEQMPSVDHELYTFRKSASMYFGVAYPEQVKASSAPVLKKSAPKTVTPVKKKKKKMPEGGC